MGLGEMKWEKAGMEEYGGPQDSGVVPHRTCSPGDGEDVSLLLPNFDADLQGMCLAVVAGCSTKPTNHGQFAATAGENITPTFSDWGVPDPG